MPPDATPPIAEYRVYLCDVASAIEPYLIVWSQITAGRWFIRYRRVDGREKTIDGPADGSAADLILASRAAMQTLLTDD